MLRDVVSEISAADQRTGKPAAARQITRQFASYRGQITQITNLQNSGRISAAIEAEPPSAATSDLLGSNLSGQIARAQARFQNSAADATSWLSGLTVAIPLLFALTAVLALIGLRERINEYR
jgi:hypothetical protein